MKQVSGQIRGDLDGLTHWQTYRFKSLREESTHGTHFPGVCVIAEPVVGSQTRRISLRLRFEPKWAYLQMGAASSACGGMLFTMSVPVPSILGEFNPLLLQLKLHVGRSDDSAAAERTQGTYFHEYVHFLQCIGTTYSISSHFETLAWIAEAVRQMGGHNELILSGLAMPVRQRPLQHLAMHRNMDGAYGSRQVLLPTESKSLGLLNLNESTACYEYIRWNLHDQCYFSTPVGAYTLHENLASLSETIGMAPGEQIPIVLQNAVPSSSPLHNYTVGTEFFWNVFDQKQTDPNSLIVTAAAFMDACLQIPNSRHKMHPAYIGMTSPSIRFAMLSEVLPEVRFIDHLDDQDYPRFIEDLFAKMRWPAPPQIFQEHLEWLSPIVQAHVDSIDNYRSIQPQLYDKYFNDQIARTRHNLEEMYGATHTSEWLEGHLADFERALRSDPLVCAGKFGLGLLDYIVRALKIRVEHPLWMVFPQLHFDELKAELPLPVEWMAENENHTPSARAMSLFYDIKASHHLWALTMQWLLGERNNLKCGYRYFEMQCPEPVCQDGRCPNWKPNSAPPDFNCNFIGVTKYFGLWKKE
jgi:hypothetical protein